MPADGARRLFFALWPSDPVAFALDGLAGRSRSVCGGRQTLRPDLHLTLAFLGDVTTARQRVAESVATEVAASAVDILLDRIGYWKHNRILWAGCSAMPETLLSLADDLSARLRDAGFALETRPFAAHITLLRNARCAELPPFAQPVAWRAEDFVLAASAPGGSGRYAELRRWPLRSDVAQ